MGSYYKVRAIVLNRYVFGEKSRIVEVVSREQGKQGVRARGSVDSLQLEPLNEGELVLYNTKGRDYVHTFDVTNYFSSIKDSYIRLDTAMEIVKDVHRYVPYGFKDVVLFEFLHRTLVVIEGEDSAKLKQIPVVFKWLLAKLMGYSPQLNVCSVCGRQVDGEKVIFSVEDGGVVCNSCFKGKRGTTSIDMETLRNLNFILCSEDIGIANRVEIRYPIRRFLSTLGDRYLGFHLRVRGGNED